MVGDKLYSVVSNFFRHCKGRYSVLTAIIASRVASSSRKDSVTRNRNWVVNSRDIKLVEDTPQIDHQPMLIIVFRNQVVFGHQLLHHRAKSRRQTFQRRYFPLIQNHEVARDDIVQQHFVFIFHPKNVPHQPKGDTILDLGSAPKRSDMLLWLNDRFHLMAFTLLAMQMSCARNRQADVRISTHRQSLLPWSYLLSCFRDDRLSYRSIQYIYYIIH